MFVPAVGMKVAVADFAAGPVVGPAGPAAGFVQMTTAGFQIVVPAVRRHPAGFADLHGLCLCACLVLGCPRPMPAIVAAAMQGWSCLDCLESRQPTRYLLQHDAGHASGACE